MKTIEEWDGDKWWECEPLILTDDQYKKILTFYEFRHTQKPKTNSPVRIKFILDNFVTKEKRPSFKEMGKKFDVIGLTIKCTIFKLYHHMHALLKHSKISNEELENLWQEYKKLPDWSSNRTEDEDIKYYEVEKKMRRLRRLKPIQEQYEKFFSNPPKLKKENMILNFKYETFRKYRGEKALIADCEKCKELFIVTNLSVYVRKNRPVLNCLNCNENLVY
jgi:hypothetical protein